MPAYVELPPPSQGCRCGWRHKALASDLPLMELTESRRPGKIIASFPLPADWETVERMLNAVWKDGPEWSGANTVAGVRWILDEHDGHLLVVDVSEEA